MRRLSIIDLDTGDQPIFNEDRSMRYVFNGEIYNYVELRDELEKRGHRFRTQTDTETLVHLYEAVWDGYVRPPARHVCLRPVGCAGTSGCCWRSIMSGSSRSTWPSTMGGCCFASEVKALFADTRLPRRLNLDVLDTYLTFGYMIGAETLYEGVRRLPPGHALIVEKGAQHG